MTTEELQLEQLRSLKDQLDILNQSIFINNSLLLFCSGALAIISLLLIFMVGYLVTKRG
jgi:collagenase-like PrtC family protease